MKHLHFLAFALCWLVWGHLLKAQSIDHYSSLDPSQPIEFKGNCLRYADKEIILGPKTFLLMGSCPIGKWRIILMSLIVSIKLPLISQLVRKRNRWKFIWLLMSIGLMIQMTLLFVLVKTDVNRSAWLLNALISILSDWIAILKYSPGIQPWTDTGGCR